MSFAHSRRNCAGRPQGGGSDLDQMVVQFVGVAGRGREMLGQHRADRLHGADEAVGEAAAARMGDQLRDHAVPDMLADARSLPESATTSA